jgi:hypothetical protein
MRPPAVLVSRRRAAPATPGDLPLHGRVDHEVAERLDERHVRAPEPPTRLDVDGHLGPEAVVAGLDPGEMHHAVHRPVGDLGGELPRRPVERHEGEVLEPQPGGGVALRR